MSEDLITVARAEWDRVARDAREAIDIRTRMDTPSQAKTTPSKGGKS